MPAVAHAQRIPTAGDQWRAARDQAAKAQGIDISLMHGGGAPGVVPPSTCPATGTQYYASSSLGSDANDGLSPTHVSGTHGPWASISKLNSPGLNFTANQCINLKGGDTFTGCLVLKTGVNVASSSAVSPMYVTSYGTGVATLNSNCPGSQTAAFTIDGVNGITVEPITVRAAGTMTQYGILVINSQSSQSNGVTLIGADVSGFWTNINTNGSTAAEIYVSGGYGTGGITNVTVQSCVLHGASVTSTDDAGLIGNNENQNILNLTVEGCDVYNMGSLAGGCNGSSNCPGRGEGILVDGVNGATVRFNRVHDIGANTNVCGGSSGLEIYASNNVIREWNEVYNVRPLNGTYPGSGCDWDGFDVDGGSTLVTDQFNYSHNNGGAGFLHWMGTVGSFGWGPNINRYNISENDNTLGSQIGGGFASYTFSGEGAATAKVYDYNNTIYQGNAASGVSGFSASGGNLIGPTGNLKKLQGVAVSDTDTAFYGAPLAAKLRSLFPNINLVRLAVAPQGSGPYTWATPASLAPFVNAMTALGAIVVIENHDTNVSLYTGSTLTAESAWYASLGTYYLGNPFVMYQTMNEPAANDSPQMQATYTALRGTGYDGVVFVEAGQGASGGVGAFTASTSSVGSLTWFASATNVAWDLHCYNWQSSNSTSVSTIQNDQNARIVAFQAVSSSNAGGGVMPVITLETGVSTSGTTPDAGGSQEITASFTNANLQGASGWTLDIYNGLNVLSNATANSSVPVGSIALTSPYGVQVAGYTPSSSGPLTATGTGSSFAAIGFVGSNSTPTTGSFLANNVIVTTTGNKPIVCNNYAGGNLSLAPITFKSNGYSGGAFSVAGCNSGSVASLPAWQAVATGGDAGAMTASPSFTGTPPFGTLSWTPATQTGELPGPTGYEPQSPSYVNVGLNLSGAPYSQTLPTQDYAGNTLPTGTGTGYPIGSLIGVSGPAAVVTGCAASPASGLLVAGNSTVVTCTFSNSSMAVTGSPTATLNNGTVCTFLSVSGANVSWTCAILSGQNTPISGKNTYLAMAPTNAIQVAGATITSTGVPAVLTGANGIIFSGLAANTNAAYFISTSGTDTGSGTGACQKASPCATLNFVRGLMEANSTKQVYARGGSYTPSSTCTWTSDQGSHPVVTTVVCLTPSDNSTAWLGYPGESPAFNGGATNSSTGVNDVFYLSGGVNGVTINGLRFNNFTFGDIEGNNVSNLTVTNNIGDGLYQPSGSTDSYGFVGMFEQIQNEDVEYNLVMNTQGSQIVVISDSPTSIGASGTNNTVAHNIFLHGCKGLNDCGIIYGYDPAHTMSGCKWNDNIVGDFGPAANSSSAAYFDDYFSNCTVTQNQFYSDGNGTDGTGTWMVHWHGGNLLLVNSNLFDMGGIFSSTGAPGMPPASARNPDVHYYQSATQPTINGYTGVMDGNQHKNNIIYTTVAPFTSSCIGGSLLNCGYLWIWENGNAPDIKNPAVSNNAYRATLGSFTNLGSNPSQSSGSFGPVSESGAFSGNPGVSFSTSAAVCGFGPAVPSGTRCYAASNPPGLPLLTGQGPH